MAEVPLTEETLLERWKKMADDQTEKAWTEDDVRMFFQNFRPDGAGLEGVFDGLPGAEEMESRLHSIFEVTAGGVERDWYFIVRQPQRLSRQAAEALALACRTEFASLTRHIQQEDADFTECAAEIDEKLSSGPSDTVFVQALTPPVSGLDRDLYDLFGDYGGELVGELPAGYVVQEALYTMAADYRLTYWVLWPALRSFCPLPDPFASYAGLWRHGLHLSFSDAGQPILSALFAVESS